MDDDEDDGPDLRRGVPASALREASTMKGTFDGETLVLVRHEGRCHALSGKCTHLEAPLADGLVVDGALRCPWHHARFSIETGEAIAAPAFEPLSRFDVDERDGMIRVVGKRRPVEVAARDSGIATRVVIVGAGAAGHACAEMLARLGHGGRTTLVDDDGGRPYDRTFCSKQYLIGMVERDACFLPGIDRDGTDRVVRVTKKVASIDATSKRIAFDDGATLAFDVLVLATGAEPKRPELPGFDLANVHLLRTLADADAIVAAAKDATRVAIVGASFIGLEAAASLTQRKLEVQVVSPDRVPLEKIVGAEVGAMIRGVHEEKGVRFHLGRDAKAFDGRRLTLDDDSTLDVDFVVVGVGVAPRTALAEAAGLTVASQDDGGGIVVDGRLETSVPGIHAIGDIARYPDRHAGRTVRVEHWVHAQRQGQYVARRLMRSADEAFDDLPFFWSAHFDTGLRYLGHVDRIRDMDVDGSIEGRDFTVRYEGDAHDEAFATCNRDLPALEVEARWEGRDFHDLEGKRS